MAEINQEQLHELVESMRSVVGDEGSVDSIEPLIRLLSLSDDQFVLLSAGIMQSYQQSINNPNDKLTLVQTLNASGKTAEDLIADFNGIAEEIDKTALSSIKKDFLKEMIAMVCRAINETEGIAKRTIPIGVELCSDKAKIPQYAHISDSGMDVYALSDITINPGETVLVPTGIKLAIPAGFEIQVRPKSGRALKTKLRIANTPGTIDQGYRDEIKVIVENIDPPIRAIHFGRPIMIGDIQTGYDDEYFGPGCIEYGQAYTIGEGEKFCQLVLVEVPKAALYRVDNVLEVDGETRTNAQGESGFGSTGLK